MRIDNELDAMTDEQAADYYYRHRDEIEQVGAASEAAGMKISTFIRQTALAVATHEP